MFQTHAEVTLAKADAALRQKEAELIRLRAEHQALRTELTAVKQGLSTSTERAEKLHVEGQVGGFDSPKQKFEVRQCVNLSPLRPSDQRQSAHRPGVRQRAAEGGAATSAGGSGCAGGGTGLSAKRITTTQTDLSAAADTTSQTRKPSER